MDKPPQPGVLWTRESTTDAVKIQRWWRRWPDSLVAIDCGKSGIVAIDVDPRKGGEWTLPGAQYPTLSGGKHVLYAEPREVIGNDNTGKVAPGVDVKGSGGYVVCWAPAEVRARPTELGPLPEVVQTAMRRTGKNDSPSGDVPSPTTESQKDGSGTNLRSEPGHAAGSGTTPSSAGVSIPAPRRPDPFTAAGRLFTLEQAAEYCRREALEPLRTAMEGYRNDQLNRSAVVFGHFVPAFWSAETVTKGLTEVALSIGLGASETAATIRSGLKRGMTEPYELRGSDPVAEAKATESDAVDRLMSEMLDTDQLDDIPELEPLIEGWLMMDTLAAIVGKSGKGKSFVSIDMACHVGTGREWHGSPVRQGLVVYLVAEGARGIRARVRAWEKYHGTKATGVKFLPRPVQAMDPEWLTLIEACRRLGPALVVIDTQARVTVGVEENSAKETGEFIERAEALRRATGACVALIHHTGHQGEEGRGSTAIKGALQTQLSVSKLDKLITISVMKQKDGVELDPLILAMVDVADTESVALVARGDSVDGEKFVAVPDPEDVFRGHVKDLVGIFLSVFSEGTGGTRPEVRTHFMALERVRNLPTDTAKRNFNRAWSRLEEMGRLVRTEGSQRYKFVRLESDSPELGPKSIITGQPWANADRGQSEGQSGQGGDGDV